MENLWSIREDSFDPQSQHHKETIFTIGNGYLSTRGAFEEGHAGERRATFIHGVFDAAPIHFTELANAPDWLPLSVFLEGERFSLTTGALESYERRLDLRRGILSRTVRWRSPGSRAATFTFERFASLADPHLLYLRCRVIPEFAGLLELRAALNGNAQNWWPGFWLAHWDWLGQSQRDGLALLRNRTRHSGTEVVTAMRAHPRAGLDQGCDYWDAENAPTIAVRVEVVPGQEEVLEKCVAVFTSRDAAAGNLVDRAAERLSQAPAWEQALVEHSRAWEAEWSRSDVVIEGDDEAQLAMRFNLFQLLIAAPRQDERVSMGAKTLSGFGYRGHSFWDTELYMLPLFTLTAPHIARNLLNYRYHNLPGARRKAQANGYEGAQFPWESADAGDEVTPTWVPHFEDRNKMVRIWPGDIEIHISADIAYAAHQYWQWTGDDDWFAERGAELVLDTAKFWASRAEWNAESARYEYRDVIGPDEYHDHVDNNAFTNSMARWNLETALQVLEWLQEEHPDRARELSSRLALSEARLAHWREVIEKTFIPALPSGLIEQFEGYFQRRDVDLAAMEPRKKSLQEVFGIEGANETQGLKQPDVLMLMYLFRDRQPAGTLKANYEYYDPRTDHTYGSSTGPAIMATLACEVGEPEQAYRHFMRALWADLQDVRGNASDGIHGASAGGTWQAAVFGFGGLKVTAEGWSVNPRLPKHWKRLAFGFSHRGNPVRVDLKPSDGSHM